MKIRGYTVFSVRFGGLDTFGIKNAPEHDGGVGMLVWTVRGPEQARVDVAHVGEPVRVPTQQMLDAKAQAKSW